MKGTVFCRTPIGTRAIRLPDETEYVSIHDKDANLVGYKIVLDRNGYPDIIKELNVLVNGPDKGWVELSVVDDHSKAVFTGRLAVALKPIDDFAVMYRYIFLNMHAFGEKILQAQKPMPVPKAQLVMATVLVTAAPEPDSIFGPGWREEHRIAVSGDITFETVRAALDKLPRLAGYTSAEAIDWALKDFRIIADDTQHKKLEADHCQQGGFTGHPWSSNIPNY
jgi:hypothetical protein